MFERADTGAWTEGKKLTASDAALFDSFGRRAVISGSRVAVSAADAGGRAGAVYVFDWNEATGQWSQSSRLVADDRQAGDWLGFSLAMSGETIIAGALGWGGLSGAAYVFDRVRRPAAEPVALP